MRSLREAAQHRGDLRRGRRGRSARRHFVEHNASGSLKGTKIVVTCYRGENVVRTEDER
jgi:hypothetical protein